MRLRTLLATVILVSLTLGKGTGLCANPRLTVYNTGQALVTESRDLELQAGVNKVIWEGVSSQADLASVQVRAGEEINLTGQRFEYDLANRQTLLNQYVGKTVQILRYDQQGREASRLTGTLISAEGGRIAILQTEKGELRLDPAGEVVLPPLQSPLVLLPRLTWQAEVKAAGVQPVEVSYLTRGLSWSASYVLALSGGDVRNLISPERGDLTGWITLSNQTGVDFKDARWRLLAQETRKLPALQPVEEKMVVEYRPDGLAGLRSLANYESLVVPLLASGNLSIAKSLVFDPLSAGPAAPTPPQRLRIVGFLPVDVLHDPLPGGRLVIYRRDVAGVSQVAADVSLAPTLVNKKAEFALGEALGVEGERKQTAFRQVAERVQEQDVEIRLRNKTDVSVRVVAVERPWGTYEITQKSHDFGKQEDGSLEFTVAVPARDETVITYRVRMKY